MKTETNMRQVGKVGPKMELEHTKNQGSDLQMLSIIKMLFAFQMRTNELTAVIRKIRYFGISFQ